MSTAEILTSGIAASTRRGRLLVSVAGLLLALGCTAPASSQAQTAPVAAMGVVTDTQSDGTPDTVSLGVFYVLNRPGPDQEERAVVEFDISLARTTDWALHATPNGGTGDAWPNEIRGYVGNGQVDLSDFDPAGGTLLGTVVAGPTDAWTVNVSTFVNERILAGDHYVGFVVRRASEGAGRNFWVPSLTSDFSISGSDQATVTDTQSDGTPDTLTPDSFFVLNRGAPNQEERAIVEFAIDTTSSDFWIFRAAGLGGTGTAWPNELWGYRADGVVTLSDYAVDDAPVTAALGVVTDTTSDGTPDNVLANNFFVLNRGAPNQEERGVIEFDIRGKTGDSWLFVAHAAGGTGTVWPNQLWGYVADGALTLSDFAPAGAVLLDTVDAGPNDTWIADVSGFVNQRLSNGDDYVGFMVRRADLGSGRNFWNPVMDSDFDELLATVVAGPNDSWSVDVSAFVNQRRAAGDKFVGFLVRRSTLGAGRNFYGPSLDFDPTLFQNGFE
jgi:hypothetical protein